MVEKRKDFSAFQKSKRAKYVLTEHGGNVVVETNNKHEYDKARLEYIQKMKMRIPKSNR